MNKPEFKNFVSNSAFDFIIATLLAATVILIDNIRSIFSAIDKDSYSPNDTTLNLISDQISQILLQLNEIPNASNIITAVIFIVAGVFLYFAYIVLSNVVITAENDVHMLDEVHDSSAKRYLILRDISKIFSAVLYLVFVFVSFKELAPHWLESASEYFLSGFNTAELDKLIVGLVGFSVNIFLLILLGKFSLQYSKSL